MLVSKGLKIKSINYGTQNALPNKLVDSEQNSEQTIKKHMCWSAN